MLELYTLKTETLTSWRTNLKIYSSVWHISQKLSKTEGSMPIIRIVHSTTVQSLGRLTVDAAHITCFDPFINKSSGFIHHSVITSIIFTRRNCVAIFCLNIMRYNLFANTLRSCYYFNVYLRFYIHKSFGRMIVL